MKSKIKKTGLLLIGLVLSLFAASVPAEAYNFFADYPSYKAKPQTINPRILMVGNSLTFYNDLPSILANMCKSTGIQATVDSVTRGGHSLTQYAFPSTEVEEQLSQTLMNKLNQKWDYVILQGRSDETISCYSTMAKAIAKLYPLIKQSGAQMVLYLTWAPEYKFAGYNLDTRQGQIADAYYGFAKQYQCALAPSGIAFARMKKLYPDWDVHYSKEDRLHPNMLGSYLSGCCIYGTLFGNSPENLKYTANIPGNTVKVLQGIAADLTVNNQSTVHQVVTVTAAEKGYLLKKGETKTAAYRVSGGNARIISCTSSDTAVAEVTASGRIKAKKSGTAVISAVMSNNQTISWDVTVTSMKRVTLWAGDSIALDIPSAQFKWKTSDKDIATVKKGKIKAVNPGSVTLTGTKKSGAQIQLKITVKKAQTKLKIKNAPETMQVGEKVELQPNMKWVMLSYRSSNSKIISVNSRGELSAKKPGTVNIMAEAYNGVKVSFRVSAYIPVKSLRIRNLQTGQILEKGQTLKLKLAFSPTNASDKTVKYASSNKKVVAVDQKGNIKAVGKGMARITVRTKDGSKKKTIITVRVE